jgi:hypothetical protein
MHSASAALSAAARKGGNVPYPDLSMCSIRRLKRSYSITSWASRVGEIVRPNALAVLRSGARQPILLPLRPVGGLSH